jgi:hypothetical protein
VKRRVLFLGYYMFLLSQTIKEEILPTPLLPTEKYRYRLYLIPGNTDTEKMTGTTVVSNSSTFSQFLGILAHKSGWLVGVGGRSGRAQTQIDGFLHTMKLREMTI